MRGRDGQRRWRARANWIWPRITDEASATIAVNQAMIYAVFLTMVTAGIVIASVVSGHAIGGFDGWNSVDVALIGVIAFGLRRRSRVAAMAGVSFWLLSAAGKLADGQRPGIITVVILLGFIAGIRGTFALAKYGEARAPQVSLACPMASLGAGVATHEKIAESAEAWSVHSAQRNARRT